MPFFIAPPGNGQDPDSPQLAAWVALRTGIDVLIVARVTALSNK
jgi:hypothetical protein